jgi:hypothetical protein
MQDELPRPLHPDSGGGAGWEIITDTLYAYEQLEPGAEKVVFFQEPIGIGGRTEEATNMVLCGALPVGVEFLLEQLEVAFFPDLSATERVIKRQYIKLAASGRLRLMILDKTYLDLAPLGGFMRPWTTTTRAAVGKFREIVDRAPWTHGPFKLGRRIHIVSSAVFAVEVSWDHGAPIKAPGRLGVVFHGYRYRGAS